tara:strand:- start:234 stop:1016 length:783 start_codon:yes stop_codon:yes gene_type:complete
MENFIREYKIDTGICDDLIKYFHRNPEKQITGQTAYGVNKQTKDSVDLYLDPEDDIFNEYVDHLKNCFDSYQEDFPLILKQLPSWGISEPIILQWYKPGQGYHAWHSERGGTPDPEIQRRFLVWITYLNDAPNAGTAFKYFPELKVEAVKGKTIVWPVDWMYTHKGIKSCVVNKYIATGWMSFVTQEQINTELRLKSPTTDIKKDESEDFIDKSMNIEKDGLGELGDESSEVQENYEWPFPAKGEYKIEDRFNSDMSKYS